MMNRHNNYLDTISGQLSLRNRRKRKRFLIAPIKLEPKSKTAMPETEKVAFQSAILENLKYFQKRYFRAPVALEFDFVPVQNDPPAAHTVTKNYLDLLQHPMPELKTRRKRLLLEDDRQVHYLAVKYRIMTERKEPSISVKVAPYSNLVEDLSLLHKLQTGEVQEDPRNCFLSYEESISWDEIIENEETDTSTFDAINRLKDHERRKESWVANFGNDAYEACRQMLIIDVQNDLIKNLTISPKEILHLLVPLYMKLPPEFEEFYALSRDNMISPPFAIDLHHSDLKQGESVTFRKAVGQAIDHFKKRLPMLFPLQVQIGVTILFQPPKRGGIDLDNLARRIIPFVNQEMQPPSNLLFTVDLNRLNDNNLKKWFLEKRQHLRRMPQYSVNHYQVVQLPRLTSDEDHGFVRLILSSGRHFSTLWGEIEHLADKWQEAVKR